jgi:hypothetical protein
MAMVEAEDELKSRKALLESMDHDANYLFYNEIPLDEYSIKKSIWLVLFLYREYRRSAMPGINSIQATDPTNKGIEGYPELSDEKMLSSINTHAEAIYSIIAPRLVTNKDLNEIHNRAFIMMLTLLSLFTVIILTVVGWMLSHNDAKPEPSISAPYKQSH